MIKRSWLALPVAVAVLATAPAVALAARSTSVTKGLDYLHSQQAATGGYGNSTATGWVILGAVATGERMSSNAWSKAGKNPVSALQTTNHLTSANATSNVVEYYSTMILSYMAADRKTFIYAAGTTDMNLLEKLYSYQDIDPASVTKGSFSPDGSANRLRLSIRSTAWAIVAIHSMGLDNTRLQDAVGWLKTKQNADGGFSYQPGNESTTSDTALALQALRAGGTVSGDSLIQDALDYLDGVQLTSGGFPDQEKTSAVKDADATADAIQAIGAAGDDPSSGRWRTSTGMNPFIALTRLQATRGAFKAEPDALINPVVVTGHAVMALSHQNFNRYPQIRPPAVKAFVYRPHFNTISPKGGVTFKTTQIVPIRATYGDGTGGTGISTAAVRLFVDNVDKTKPAVVANHGLHLTLKKVPNGKHTYKIVLKDRAGNQREVTRTFTVAVPIASPAPIPTYNPTPVATPTVFPPSTYHPTPTPTPTATATLYPTPTATPSPTPFPSASGTPITGAPVNSPSPGPGSTGSGGNGGGSAAGFLGGTLLAMLPLGAALTYYLLHRREEAMAGAMVGEELPGGGSDWERAKGALAKSGDIVKPVRS